MEDKNYRKIILSEINSQNYGGNNNDNEGFEGCLSIDTSMNSPTSTSLTLSLSGCAVIDELNTIKHILEPELKLPTLKDRASRSKMKDLYDISKQLMPSDNEEEESGSTFENENDKSLKGSKSSDLVVKGDKIDELITIKHMLEPELKLPTLKDRASRSKIKDLYDISKQLMPSDNEDEESGSTFENENNKSLKGSKSSDLVVKGDKKNEDIIQNKVTLEKQEERMEDLKNSKKRGRKSLRSKTGNIATMKNFERLAGTELLTAKRNLKVPKRKRQEHKHKPIQTLLDSQDECTMRNKFFKFIDNKVKYDTWLWFSLILLLVCTSVYILYITVFDISEWHSKKTYYDSLKAHSNFIMKCYYSLRIWLIQP